MAAKLTRLSPGIYRDSSGATRKLNPAQLKAANQHLAAGDRRAPKPPPRTRDGVRYTRGQTAPNYDPTGQADPSSFQNLMGYNQSQIDSANQFNQGVNNPNQTDVMGNERKWVQGPDGRMHMIDTLGEENRYKMDLSSNLNERGLRTANEFLQGFHPSQTGDVVADRQNAQQGIYGNLTKNLERQYGQQKEDIKQDLQNRGIPVGSAAYERQMGNFENQYQTYRQQAQDQAISASGQEMANQYGMQGQAIDQAGRLGSLGLGFQAPQFNPVNNNITYGQGAPNAAGQYGAYAGGQAGLMQGNAAMINAGVNQGQLGIAQGILNQINAANAANTGAPSPGQAGA